MLDSATFLPCPLLLSRPYSSNRCQGRLCSVVLCPWHVWYLQICLASFLSSYIIFHQEGTRKGPYTLTHFTLKQFTIKLCLTANSKKADTYYIRIKSRIYLSCFVVVYAGVENSGVGDVVEVVVVDVREVVSSSSSTLSRFPPLLGSMTLASLRRVFLTSSSDLPCPRPRLRPRLTRDLVSETRTEMHTNRVSTSKL